MSALTKSDIHPATTLRESMPNISLVEPEAKQPRRALVALTCMLIACATFAGIFAISVLIPAIKTLMGT